MMQFEGIISNPLNEDIRSKGHQSIRFKPDGFSFLLADASYKPVILEEYIFDDEVGPEHYPAECQRILQEKNLDDFHGETSILLDSSAFSLIPDEIFHEDQARRLLEKSAEIGEQDELGIRHLRERNLQMLFAIPQEITSLVADFGGKVRMLHSLECLISLADQIQASDHQRGFIILDIQDNALSIAAIQGDKLQLVNWYQLHDPSDFIYHSLNTLKQLEMDRETLPVYMSGIVHPEHELNGLIRKYIRQIKITPYYLESLSKIHLQRYMVLSEGSKCG